MTACAAAPETTASKATAATTCSISADDGRNVILGFDPDRDVIRLVDDTPFTITFNDRTGDSVLRYGETTVVLRDVDLPANAITVHPLAAIALTGIDANDFASPSDSGLFV